MKNYCVCVCQNCYQKFNTCDKWFFSSKNRLAGNLVAKFYIARGRRRRIVMSMKPYS